jgi:hypothetical protein
MILLSVCLGGVVAELWRTQRLAGQDSCCFPKGNVAVFLLETKMTGL